MYTFLSPKAIWTCETHIGRKVSPHSGHHHCPRPASASCFLASHGPLEWRDKYFVQHSESRCRLSCHNVCTSKLGATNRSLRLHVYASSGDEYRSSRNIAVNLYTRYRNFVDRGGADNLKEFIRVGVNAYSLGCTDEGLRKELLSLKDSGVEIELEQNYGGKTGLKSKIYSEESFPSFEKELPYTYIKVRECILWLSIVFITILCTPQPTVIRWSSTPPVSDEIMLQWKGFCALIANAYYVKGMAWLPVKTLQLEQMVVMGRAEEPSIVSSRMRLVFSTLEVVSPQWPRV